MYVAVPEPHCSVKFACDFVDTEEARPRSAMAMSPLALSNKFSGFKSLWTMFLLCKYFIPSAVWTAYRIRYSMGGGNGALNNASASDLLKHGAGTRGEPRNTGRQCGRMPIAPLAQLCDNVHAGTILVESIVPQHPGVVQFDKHARLLRQSNKTHSRHN